MSREHRQSAAFSRISANGRTLIPRDVRERLGLKPGDTLRYRATEAGFLLDKANIKNPFSAFPEWTSEADEKAYSGL